MEVCLAFSALVVLAPLLLLVAVCVRLSSKGPILFRQIRVGLGGRDFTMLKFRTMRAGSKGPKLTARGDGRVTTVGNALRLSKLDELPQLWNVVRGDMALVGPRPEVPQFVDRTNPLWLEVLAWRPGISDPVAVALRDEERVLAGVRSDRERYYREVLQPSKLDGYVKYLRRRTAWSDIGVILGSLGAIVSLPWSRRAARRFKQHRARARTRVRARTHAR
jgi:lipopolysaccharide/colanic/teichoic acid biosynthesis glycosyltransferase